MTISLSSSALLDRTRWFYLGLVLLSAVSIMGQSTLRGTVIDLSTSEPLPYATIAILASSQGTTSDAQGKFELSDQNLNSTDSVEISYIGYQSVRFSIHVFDESTEIGLSPSAEILDVVIVRPLSASDYLKVVQQKLEENTAQHSFNTISHYEEKTTENGKTLDHNEGIFKSWQNAYRKGAEHHHQLALFRKEDIEQLEFMRKKAAKEKKKYLKKHPDKAEEFEEGQLFITDFGGPEGIQKLNLYSRSLYVLDSTKHKHFEFEYLPESEYMGSPLTVISYSSKGKVDDRRYAGTIYIDRNKDAVVWVKEKGSLIIPILIRPIMVAMGIQINSLTYEMELKMRPVNGRWYPQFTHWNVLIDIKKKYMFAKNEKARFEIKQELETSEIITENVNDIPEQKRFDSSNKMEEQIFPISGLNW